MLNDQVCVQVQEILGYRMVRPMNGNLNLVQSFVEQLSGDSDLISLRSRASLDRPFTRLKEMEAKAGREWEDKAQGAGGEQGRNRAQNQRIAVAQVRQRTEIHPLARTAEGNGELPKNGGRRQQGTEIVAQEIGQGHRRAGILDQSGQHRRHAGAGGRDRALSWPW